MKGRGRISGRHFALMRAVMKGEVRGEPSPQMNDLISWGYVMRDGDSYGPTDQGEKAFRTWQDMEDHSR